MLWASVTNTTFRSDAFWFQIIYFERFFFSFFSCPFSHFYCIRNWRANDSAFHSYFSYVCYFILIWIIFYFDIFSSISICLFQSPSIEFVYRLWKISVGKLVLVFFSPSISISISLEKLEKKSCETNETFHQVWFFFDCCCRHKYKHSTEFPLRNTLLTYFFSFSSSTEIKRQTATDIEEKEITLKCFWMCSCNMMTIG